MVSTRQMATSSGNGNSGNSSIANNVEESARLSVVTRQSGSNCGGINYTTIQSLVHSSQQRNLCNISTTSGRCSQFAVKSTSGSTSGSTHSNVIKTVAINFNGTAAAPQLNLLDLPNEILCSIFSYVGFKKIGQLRMVSHKMNDICMHILNSNFNKSIKKTYNHFNEIKKNMPRRESARRTHPLACECDIVETCYMRLSLLQMTFGKHIERGHCCFFPGAILDEIDSILSFIKSTPHIVRPYRVTDELFDLSTMAMEYFKDRIEPTLPGIGFNKNFYAMPSTSKRPALKNVSDHSDKPPSKPSPPQSNMVLRKGIRKIKQGMKIYNNHLQILRNDLRTCKRKSSEQGKLLSEQQKQISEQQKQTLEYANRLDENDKKYEEMSRKFSTLLQELNKCKTELQYWRSKSPAVIACTSCGQKIPPGLPSEDYQVLINQGIKPQNILQNDDTDAESDTSSSEHNVMLSNEFVFPDKATTAKLIAVNTATKILKRQYANTSSTSTSDSNANTSNVSNSNSTTTTLSNSKPSTITLDKPSDLMNSLDYSMETVNIIRAPSPSCYNQDKDIDCITNNKNNCRDVENSNCSNKIGNNGNTTNHSISAYSTKLFYGINAHKGVIVSPSKLTKELNTTTVNNLMSDPIIIGNHGKHGSFNANGADSSDNCANPSVTFPSEDVSTLNAITSHETKKARRVQKAMRCINGSGKRSK